MVGIISIVLIILVIWDDAANGAANFLVGPIKPGVWLK